MDSQLERKLRTLLDKQEIHEILLRQSRGLDRADPALLETIFHPEATRLTPEGPKREPDAQLSAIKSLKPDQRPTWHFLGNHLIEVDGDVAYSETYFLACSEVLQGDTVYTRFRAGRYLDRFERREGEWGCVYRVMTDDWSRLDELKQAIDLSKSSLRGRPSREDPLYTEIMRDRAASGGS
jgi:hypothetical protein